VHLQAASQLSSVLTLNKNTISQPRAPIRIIRISRNLKNKFLIVVLVREMIRQRKVYIYSNTNSQKNKSGFTLTKILLQRPL